jgi:uncharacterized protein (TIGR02246 family)
MPHNIFASRRRLRRLVRSKKFALPTLLCDKTILILTIGRGRSAFDNNFSGSFHMRTFMLALAGGILVVAVALAAGPRRAGADGDALQRLLDKDAINTVLVDYTHALDTLDADKYAGVFAEDAVFDMGRETRTGRAEIRDVVVGLQKSRAERATAGTSVPTLMHHVMTNETLEIVSGTEAHHYAYWMTILGGADDKFNVASMGHYEDVLVKRDGRWLIQSRKLLR